MATAVEKELIKRGEQLKSEGIVIRTYVARHGRVYFSAGGGIVADSDPEEEYRETLAKARALIDAKYTSVKRIVGHGGSAGGMLMGAVANRAGDLFAGIVAEVPFVDVLNTMRDDTLPLTPPEWPEWGNPVTSETAFRSILSYSPYENVAAKTYPAILAMGGLTDPRVTYWEPAKWVARLRATMQGGGPVLLRTNMGAGHGGASGRFVATKSGTSYPVHFWPSHQTYFFASDQGVPSGRAEARL